MTTATKPLALPVLLPTREKQNRWTIGLRYLLAIPQFIVLYLLSIAALVVAVIGWFAALFTGALPTGIAKFLGQWVAYSMRVTAYLYLLTDRYPLCAQPIIAPPRQHGADQEVRDEIVSDSAAARGDLGSAGRWRIVPSDRPIDGQGPCDGAGSHRQERWGSPGVADSLF